MDDTVYDLCIVGAGLIGAAAARHASARAGIKVCLIGPEEPEVSTVTYMDMRHAVAKGGLFISLLHCTNQGPYTPNILQNVLCLILQVFPYLKACEFNTIFGWLNRVV